MSWGKSPPTSVERDSLPSEKAPAPEKPVVMWQGLQPTQRPVWALGQRRSSMARPFSTSRMRLRLPWRSSSMAVKMPAGPAPMMRMSVCMENPPFRGHAPCSL